SQLAYQSAGYQHRHDLRLLIHHGVTEHTESESYFCILCGSKSGFAAALSSPGDDSHSDKIAILAGVITNGTGCYDISIGIIQYRGNCIHSAESRQRESAFGAESPIRGAILM